MTRWTVQGMIFAILFVTFLGCTRNTVVRNSCTPESMHLKILRIDGLDAKKVDRRIWIEYITGFSAFYPVVKCTTSGRYRLFLGVLKSGNVASVHFMDGHGYDTIKGIKARRCVFNVLKNLRFEKLQFQDDLQSIEIEVDISNKLTPSDVEYEIPAPLDVPEFIVKNNGGRWCGEGALKEHRHLWEFPNCTIEEGTKICKRGCITFDHSPSQGEWQDYYRLSVLSVEGYIVHEQLQKILSE